MVQTMVAKGHQVATHSYWHNDMTTISEDGVHQEWQSSEESIEAAGGVKTTVGRAPYGSFGLREWKASGDVLSLLVGWNIDSNDWNAPSAQSIVDEVISHASSGDIVLFHDGGAKREKTVEALDTLLPQLQEMGYRFVTVDELYALCPPPE
jgi:peptidoglycan/xylan/chitin deacetylase (PgdA/CDA1 family)